MLHHIVPCMVDSCMSVWYNNIASLNNLKHGWTHGHVFYVNVISLAAGGSGNHRFMLFVDPPNPEV